MVEFGHIQTPFYLYDLDLLDQTVSSAAFEAGRRGYILHYALKANHNPVIAGIIKKFGIGADCVSGNEVRRSIEYGFPTDKIVFAGVGKTDEEIRYAIRKGILSLNCESIEELEVVRDIAESLRIPARVSLRVNPSVEAGTHRNITTGMDENKFGIGLQHLPVALDICSKSDWLDFTGLHFHIGSQITSLQPFRDLCHKVNHIWEDYNISGHGGYMVNLGGGLGIDYLNPEQNAIPDFRSFFSAIHENLRLPEGVEIHFELGRSLVGQCGSLITKVLFTKRGTGRNFVIADAGMTELMRPSLYQAVHKIVNLSSEADPEIYDVVGPVCESTDIFARDIMLPSTGRGDILRIFSCGAYAESMTLNFNLRDRAEPVYISGNKIIAGIPELDHRIYN